MKLSHLFLAASLAANAAVVAFYVIRQPSLAPAADLRGQTDSLPKPETQNPKPTSASSTLNPAQSAALAELRTQLQSGDLTTLVAQLRAAGFSPSLIRSIVSAQVYEQFAAKRKAVLSALPEREYWKSQSGFFIDPKSQAALRDLGKEQTALIKNLLGPDGQTGAEEQQFYQRAQYGNIPREKVDRIQAILADYSDLSQEVYAKTSGTIQLPEDREKLALIEKEKLADLAKILTPEELEDYQLRTSSAASQLRYNLASFNPTEAEFRALYRATAAVEAQLGPQGNVRTMDDMKKRNDALLARLQGTLSPERIAEVKMAIDPEYQSINRVVARLELPPATSQTVVAVQKDIQQRAAAVRNDRALTPEARNTQLAALADEATTKLTASLTPRGFEAYKTYGGAWVQNLVPPARPPTLPAATAK